MFEYLFCCFSLKNKEKHQKDLKEQFVTVEIFFFFCFLKMFQIKLTTNMSDCSFK